MIRNALIIFIKTPIPGQVKTRLQPHITEDQSAELYSAFLKDLDYKFQNQDEFACWYAVAPENFDKNILNQLVHLNNYFFQAGVDLGERMHHAFQTLFSKGYEKIVLIGSDLPTISVDIVSQTLQDLTNNECVIGPSKDGGYYLIALSKLYSELFEDLPWSSTEVLQKTIEILDEKSITYKLLPEFEDIDTYKELYSFYQELKDKPKDKADFPKHGWSVTSKLFEKR
jgi:rSAM/selenodomain-associated transferase 1